MGAQPPVPRGRVLGAAIVIALAMSVVLVLLDAPLRNDVAGSGIVSLEVAGDEDRAIEIIDSWRASDDEDAAAFGLGLDCLYVPLYAFAIAGACLAIGRRLESSGRPKLASAAIPIAWLALAAGAFDWAENVSLAVELLDEPVSPWPQLALAFAIPKFAFSVTGIIYALTGAAIGVRRAGR